MTTKKEPKPIHKFNSGLGATLCNECYVIISKGLTEELFCEKCKHKQETLEEFIFKLTWRLGRFIDMINSLPDDTEKNRILKSVFNNREGELLLESYKSMKLHYEK